VVLLVFSIALVAGFDLVPMDSHILVSGIMATVFLSLSMGFFNNIALSISKAWNIIFVTLLISMYISSGVVIPVAVLPEEIQYIISFNPLFHSVEWLRSAYFEDSSYYMLSKTYLLGVGLAFMLLGLMGERFLRGKMLAS
jgi:capsular polysaccharide transport system permease protein